MNLFLLFCVLFALSSACTEGNLSDNFEVLCCSDRIVFIKDHIVVYESSNIEYPCRENVNVGESYHYILLVAVAFGCCICCVPCLFGFVVIANC